jgi:transposase
MRQTHLGGDKLFVDYAGDTAAVVIDRLTGEIKKAQIFVAVLGHRTSPMRGLLRHWLGGRAGRSSSGRFLFGRRAALLLLRTG